MHIHWYPLTSSKHIWPKISVAYLAKWFQYIFSVGGWRMNPWNLPLLVLAYIPTQSCKNAFFEAWTWPEPEITSPNKARDRHLFLKPDLDLKAKLAREFWQRCRSRQIFGDTKDICSNSHKLPRKLGASFFKSKDVGRHFCSYFHGVCEGFQRFCPDFEEFCQEFHQIKTFGGACTSCNPFPTPVS